MIYRLFYANTVEEIVTEKAHYYSSSEGETLKILYNYQSMQAMEVHL